MNSDDPTHQNLPLKRVEGHLTGGVDYDAWPFTLPPVRQLLRDGLELGQMTIFVGENGAGKSTLVESIAIAFGLNAEGGSTNIMNRASESASNLADQLKLVRGGGASKRGFFLRAETMHGLFSYLDSIGDVGAFHESSHGESFLDLITSRRTIRGLWILDEPESALSLPGCLALIGMLRDLVGGGSQVLLSTHSPVLAAYRGADLYEVGEWGIRTSEYDDLELVRNWRAFLAAPDRFLRHIL